MGASQGRLYYEITVADEGLCRVGWATRQASLDLGNDPASFGFGGTGADSNPAAAPVALSWSRRVNCLHHHFLSPATCAALLTLSATCDSPC